MEPQTYEITAPNGKVLSITGDHVPTETELHEIFAKAGVETGAKPSGAHPEARISAAAPPLVVGGQEYPTALPGDGEKITVQDLRDHPMDSIQRIGAQLKTDVSDPRLWLTLALSYFGPKVFTAAAPVVANAARATMSAAGRVSINPSVAMEEFSLAKPQNVLKAVSLKEQPVADRVAGYDRYMPNASGAPAATGSRLAEAPVDPSMEAIADRLAGGAGKPSKGNGTLRPRENVSDGTPLPAGPPASAVPGESPVAAPAAASPASPPPTSRPGAAATPPSAPAASSPAAAARSRQVDTVHLAPAQRTTGQMSPQWIQNDLGLAARRQGLTLSPPEFQVAEAAVREHGVSPAQAVQTVGKLQQPGHLPPASLKFSADESTQYAALRTAGKSAAEAEAAIRKMRALAKKLATPSGEQVSDAVTRRNETGRWDE